MDHTVASARTRDPLKDAAHDKVLTIHRTVLVVGDQDDCVTDLDLQAFSYQLRDQDFTFFDQAVFLPLDNPIGQERRCINLL